jgi:predicted transposase/invertase (TIGR01784 family)
MAKHNHNLPPLIPLISDYGFKVTFGNERNTLFLRKALQALIASDTPINKVEFVKNAFEGLDEDSRGGIYDLACIDENGTNFLVEMQVGYSKHFIQRMQFYALHRLNTLILRGDYHFDNLTKIYCIGILQHNIFPFPDYHNIGMIRNARSEIMDEQLTFVTIELAKFRLTAEQVQTDLEKLIYTMKTAHVLKKPFEYPEFLTEDWLKQAVKELQTRRMTADERFAYERMLINAAEEIYQIKEAKKEGRQEGKKEAEREVKITAVKKALQAGKLNLGEIAEMLDVSNEFVEEVRKAL